MKFVSAAVVAMAGSAAAFAPATSSTGSKTALNAADPMPERLWNTMVDKNERSRAVPFLPRAAPLDGTMPGDQGFDPFYLSAIPKNFAGFIQPPSWEETQGLPTLYWMRESELKHGRIAMLAWAGWVATDFGLRFPGELFSVQNIPSAYNAHDILVQQGTMTFLLLVVGAIEFCTGSVLVEVSKGENDREPGDFKLDPLKFIAGKSDDEVMTMKTKEINNGRLAMLAFGAISTQSALGDAYHSFPYIG
jgi:light-harvesting complex I chlorophyll a/b binding protein 1